MFWCSDAPEDQVICLFAGFLANPDMPLSPWGLKGLFCQWMMTLNSGHDVSE
jgi:hypothetical protein